MMLLAELKFGAPLWLKGGTLLLAVIALAALVWSYSRSGSKGWIRGLAFLFKAAGFAILAICLFEPLFTGSRPRPGSNLFLIVADNSRSLQLADGKSSETRGQAMQRALADDAAWSTRLGQDFDVRRYQFDAGFRPVKDFSELKHEGESSSIRGTLFGLAERFKGRPVAGILLLTDGNATDLGDAAVKWKDLPPVYPVAVGGDDAPVDLSVTHVAVSQTNFEAAPVTVTATLQGHGLAGEEIGVRILDEGGKEVERRLVKLVTGEPLVQRFLLRPERPGVSFYTVQGFLKGEEQFVDVSRGSREATLENNRRIATVDRGGGPFRVLYVTGRPNWEFKFLRRAMEADDELRLVGLVRIAKKEPKFAFLGRKGERTNPLFRGFDNQEDELAEKYDQPVLLRLGTEDKEELRGGFPKDAADLFRYHAVILDDVESAFFTQDQLSLLQKFVSRRGGGFLMLGGQDSFSGGKYERSAVGEMLPVYLDRSAEPAAGTRYRLELKREGWLQPAIRLRDNEEDERTRLAGMPEFRSANAVDLVKPGASVLAQVKASDGTVRPALVAQPFGRGRAAAMLIGDLWRWNMQRPDPAVSDLEKSWRQTVRWLVSDVPARVEAEPRQVAAAGRPEMQIVIRARDHEFNPLDNALAVLHVQTPDGRKIDLAAESSERTPGQYETSFVHRAPGSYRAEVVVSAPDGSAVGQREIGWSVEPQADEFRALTANRPLLEQIARESGGELVPINDLDRFVAGLPNRKIPVVESWTYPLWHRWPVFLAAFACLVAEWGLRRWKGLP